VRLEFAVTTAADVTMPQANSAQREPSMEEILASIRRIIEDSDGGKNQPVNDPGSPRRADAPAVTVEPARPEPVAKAEVDAFRAEFRAPEPPLAPAAPEPERKPVSLADVQAEMRRALPEAVAPVPAPEVAKPLRLADVKASIPPAPTIQPPAAPEAKKPVSMADIQALLDRSEPPAPQTAGAATPAPAPAPEPIAPVAQAAGAAPAAREPERRWPPSPARIEPEITFDVAPVPAARAPEPPAPEPRVAEPVAPPKPAIISAQAGRQVAAAFGELSGAFAASRQKSFDEMAEQMLRPMLQEWLDNNLPLLVERLVREEIERVARGV
jgi:cell pole-organizing protein PopZ